MTALVTTLQRVLRRTLAPAPRPPRCDAHLDRPHTSDHGARAVFRSEAFAEDLGDAYRSA